MPKKPKELTALEVKHLGLGTHNLGGVKGLYLRKTPSQEMFFLRYSDSTGRHDFSLGTASIMTLAQARKAAIAAQETIAQGESPIEKRKIARETLRSQVQANQQEEAQNKLTFQKIALEWVCDRAEHGYWAKNMKGEKETRQILEKHVFPMLWNSPIDTISAEHIRSCLEPIWQRIPSTAKKVRTYLQKIFQWAIALKKRKNRENPAMMEGALGILMEPLQKNRKPKQHHAACPVKRLPELIAEMHSYDSMSARACEFSILTATRSQAVRLAQWDEINLEKGTWIIPIEHDKVKAQNRDRTIFLSSQALDLLRNLIRFSESPYVFHSSHGSHFSDAALTMFLRGVHEKRFAQDGIGWIDPIKSAQLGKPCVITLHGTSRSTFRTWAKDDELGNNRRLDQEAVELCLLHSKNDAYNGAYDRAPLAQERRLIMQAWGDYCESLCSH